MNDKLTLPHDSLNDMGRDIYNWALKYREVLDCASEEQHNMVQQELTELVDRIATSFKGGLPT